MPRSRTCPDLSRPEDITDEDDSASDNEREKPDFTTLLWLVVAFVCCGCGCTAFVELMNNRDKGCGNLISAVEYSFCLCLNGWSVYLEHGHFPTPGAGVPLHLGVGSALGAVGYSWLTNMALGSDMPMTLFLVLKSGGLVMQLLVGHFVSGRSYSRQQVLSCFVVTFGLCLATLSTLRSSSPASGKSLTASSVWNSTLGGVVFLVGALFCRCLGSAAEEHAFSRHKVTKADVLYLRSVTGTLLFAVGGIQGLQVRASRWSTDKSLAGELFGVSLMWVFLWGNVILDYFCKLLVAKMCQAAGAIVSTLSLTLQRCCSLVLSTVYLSGSGGSVMLFAGASLTLLGGIACVQSADKSSSSLKKK